MRDLMGGGKKAKKKKSGRRNDDDDETTSSDSDFEGVDLERNYQPPLPENEQSAVEMSDMKQKNADDVNHEIMKELDEHEENGGHNHSSTASATASSSNEMDHHNSSVPSAEAVEDLKEVEDRNHGVQSNNNQKFAEI